MNHSITRYGWSLLCNEPGHQPVMYIRGDLVWTLIEGTPWPGRIDDADFSSDSFLLFIYGLHSLVPTGKETVLPWTDYNETRFFIPRPGVARFDQALSEVKTTPGIGKNELLPISDSTLH